MFSMSNQKEKLLVQVDSSKILFNSQVANTLISQVHHLLLHLASLYILLIDLKCFSHGIMKLLEVVRDGHATFMMFFLCTCT